MKKFLKITVVTGLAVCFLVPIRVLAAEKPAAKPYPLQTCVVTDEKLGDMGKPYVFEHAGREIKLCCKSCLKDFNRDTAKYLKKLDEAQKKAGK
jgi:hypothetical protein